MPRADPTELEFGSGDHLGAVCSLLRPLVSKLLAYAARDQNGGAGMPGYPVAQKRRGRVALGSKQNGEESESRRPRLFEGTQFGSASVASRTVLCRKRAIPIVFFQIDPRYLFLGGQAEVRREEPIHNFVRLLRGSTSGRLINLGANLGRQALQGVLILFVHTVGANPFVGGEPFQASSSNNGLFTQL